MRILYSPGASPVVTDSRARLNTLCQQLNNFFASAATEVAIRAEVTQSATAHQELLKGMFVRKTQGPIALRLTEDRWLELSGSQDNLARLVCHFHFGRREDDVHHCPDGEALPNCLAQGSMNLVIEVDADRASKH